MSEAKGKASRPVADVPPPERPQSSVGLCFRITDFYYYGNGIIQLMVPSLEMREEDRERLRDLFPHTIEKVYDLLAKENVLASMFDGDAKAPPKHERCVDRTGIIYDN